MAVRKQTPTEIRKNMESLGDAIRTSIYSETPVFSGGEQSRVSVWTEFELQILKRKLMQLALKL